MSDIDFMTPNDREWLLLVADALDDAPHLPNRCVKMSIEFAQDTATRLRAISKALPNLDMTQDVMWHQDHDSSCAALQKGFYGPPGKVVLDAGAPSAPIYDGYLFEETNQCPT